MIRQWQPADEAAILGLNAGSVSVLSPMGGARFAILSRTCSLLKVAEFGGRVVGFFMGFDDAAAHDSVNYRWFAYRLKRFLYIDRVVVSREFQKAGLGRRFYNEAGHWAAEHRLCWMAAEVDLQPPNTASLRFHERLGFVEVGRQVTADGKLVSLQLQSAGV
ncbi:MAG: hypothetical protein AMJ54_11435 [Deltaproteobacteria bacterium SG8_13]|nr:MAG: hypothetical protein AMJ54_11435 [Deltaproteobacteria bacterium SG8_13]